MLRRDGKQGHLLAGAHIRGELCVVENQPPPQSGPLQLLKKGGVHSKFCGENFHGCLSNREMCESFLSHYYTISSIQCHLVFEQSAQKADVCACSCATTGAHGEIAYL